MAICDYDNGVCSNTDMDCDDCDRSKRQMDKATVLDLISGRLSTMELRQHSLRRIHKELRNDKITVEQALQRVDTIED